MEFTHKEALVSEDLTKRLTELAYTRASCLMYGLKSKERIKHTKEKLLKGEILRLPLLVKLYVFDKRLARKYKSLNQKIEDLKHTLYFVINDNMSSSEEAKSKVDDIFSNCNKIVADKLAIFACTKTIFIKDEELEKELPVDRFALADR